jgi:hypothetical protein
MENAPGYFCRGIYTSTPSEARDHQDCTQLGQQVLEHALGRHSWLLLLLRRRRLILPQLNILLVLLLRDFLTYSERSEQRRTK